MGEFRRFSKPGFGGRDSGRPGKIFDRRDSGRPERRDSFRPNRNSEQDMHEATCDQCGKTCEVPFRPTTGKPVYCNDCFRKGDKFESRSSSPSHPSDELEQINMKLDKILKAMNID